jgi:type III secretory pathway component EscR
MEIILKIHIWEVQMEASNLKNMVVLRNLPSNIVDEAIIILKTNKKIRKLQKVENNKKQVNKNEINKDKDYILKEAEMIVNNYISKIENKEQKDFLNKEIKEKYKRLKKYAIILTSICILQCLIILIN